MITEIESDILRKVVKLLALANPKNGATPAEMQTAMAKAQELMTEHGIGMADVDVATAERELGASPEQFNMTREDVTMPYRDRYDFDLNVGRILKKCFGVRIVFTSKFVPDQDTRFAYSILGDEFDVKVAVATLPILHAAMRSGIRAYLKELGQKWTAAVGRPYYDGLEQGYCSGSEQGRARACAQAKKKDTDAYAIVLVDKKEAVCKFVEKEYPTLRNIRSGHSHQNNSAYTRGYTDGKSMDLSGNKLN